MKSADITISKSPADIGKTLYQKLNGWFLVIYVTINFWCHLLKTILYIKRFVSSRKQFRIYKWILVQIISQSILPESWENFEGLSDNEKLIYDDLKGPSWSPDKKLKKLSPISKDLKTDEEYKFKFKIY